LYWHSAYVLQAAIFKMKILQNQAISVISVPFLNEGVQTLYFYERVPASRKVGTYVVNAPTLIKFALF